MALTPLLIGLLLQAHGESSLNGVVVDRPAGAAAVRAGQVAQRWLEPWMKRNQKTVRRVDLGSILLMVYGAISAATLSGMWRLLPVTSFLVLVAVDGVLLAVMLSYNVFAARRLGFAREDEIADRLLRHAEEPDHGHPDGQRAVRRLDAGLRRAADDRLSPDAVHDLRRPCPALRPERAAAGARSRRREPEHGRRERSFAAPTSSPWTRRWATCRRPTS